MFRAEIQYSATIFLAGITDEQCCLLSKRVEHFLPHSTDTHTRAPLCTHRLWNYFSTSGSQMNSTTKVNPPETENIATSSQLPTCHRTLVPPPVSQPLPANRKHLVSCQPWGKKSPTQTNKYHTQITVPLGSSSGNLSDEFKALSFGYGHATCFKYNIIYNKQFL